jgi:hypothetical protein
MQPRTWPRRLRLPLLVLLALLGLLVLLALLPQLLRPTVERAASKALHTPISIGWIDVEPLSRSVALRRVSAGEDGALTVEQIAARPELSELLHGRIILENVSLAGLHGTVAQDEKGMPALRGLPFPEGGGEGGGPSVVVQQVTLRDADVQAIPPPALRKQPVAVHLEDLVLRQVPSSDSVAAYQGELHGSLDGIPLTAQARFDRSDAGTRVEAEASLTGAQIGSARLVLPPGFESLSATADGKLGYVLDSARKRDRLTLDLELAGVKLAGAHSTALTAKSITVDGLTIDVAEGSVDLGRIKIVAGSIEAALTTQGLVYPGLVPVLVGDGLAPPAPPSERTAWRITGGRIEASGALMVRRDEHLAHLELPSFAWRDIASGKSGSLRATARAAGGGTIEVGGSLGIEPATIDATVDLSELALPELTALLDMPLALAQGTASGRLELRGSTAAPRIAGSLDVRQLHTAPPSADDQERILAVDHLETRFTVEPGATGTIDVESLALSYPYAMVQREAAGIFPLDVLAGRSSGEQASGPASAASPTPGPGRSVRIGTLTIGNGRIDFVDKTTQPAYWMGLTSAEATAKGVGLAPLAVGQLELSGRQDELNPLRASVRRTGDVRWQAKATFDGLSLATLNPYLSPVLGYEAQTGSLGVDLDATLENTTLSATSALSLDRVGLQQTGLDVIQRQTGVPLTVALALLKDVSGEIALSIPVQLDTATGKYELGSFVTQAIGRAVLGALSSPLRWLGMLFGTEGPPHALAIDPIPFRPGSAALDDAGKTRLTQVARILAAHAELDVILKAQIAAEDERAVGQRMLADLAQRRVTTVRDAFVDERGSAPILPARLIVAPWTPPSDGKLDAAPAIYVEVQSR